VRSRATYWLFVAGIVVGLYFTTRVNYLLFHSLVELFSIIVAGCVFVVTWNSLKYIKNPYLIMVGISSLFIGGLDLLHTLAYKGMPIFTDYDFYANQLWIAARALESCTLLTAFALVFTRKRVNASALFVIYLGITTLLVLSIFYWKTFPVCFVAGQGLTPFKIYSEYVICTILGASLILLAKNRSIFSTRTYRFLRLSIVYTIVSELAFTIYTNNYGVYNLVGHYFKLFAFMMIYEAIVSTGIEEPFALIFKDLTEANRALEAEVEHRKKVEEELKEHELKLQASYDELQEQSEELQAQGEELLAQSEELQAQNEELARLWEKSRQSEEELQRLNDALDKRVAERTRELREKDHLLIQQSRLAAMGEMINNIAHQWRQPLNALGLLVQQTSLLYELGELDKETVEDGAKKSMSLINHMSQTIDDFRNFFKPNKERVVFNVAEEIKKTLSLIEGSLHGKHIDVQMAQKEDPAVTGFPNEFAQALINIINNAKDVLVERNVQAPQVLITVDAEEGRAVVTISDNAGGIPDNVVDKIFTPYFTTKGPSGTGVGLFMSKNIIENNMGGVLTVRNIEEGAEFRIVL